MKYSVHLGPKTETVRIENDYSETSPLMITSALIEAFFPLITGAVPICEETLKDAHCKAEAILGHKIELYSSGNDHHRPKMNPLVDEISCLRHAVINWIDAKIPPDNSGRTGHQIFADTPDGNALAYLQQKIALSPPIPVIIPGDIRRIHNSDLLTALAWAEIWNAIEYGIQARSCPYCGVVFILPPNNRQKKTCLRSACKMAYEIDRHGGQAEYRKWAKSRKMQEKDRKPGRPRKDEGGKKK